MTEDFIHKIAIGIKDWLKENTPHRIKTWPNGPNQWTVAVETNSKPELPRTSTSTRKWRRPIDGKKNVKASFLFQLEPTRIITLNNVGNRGIVLSYEDPNLNEQILKIINNPVARNQSVPDEATNTTCIASRKDEE